MATESTPKNPLERAIRDHDRALVVRFVAEGHTLASTTPAAELSAPEFPETVAMLVLKLALPRTRLEIINTNRWYHCNGDGMREMVRRALAPFPDRANAAEKKLIDAVVCADSAAVVKLVRKTPGTLRNFSPELLTMLPELTREAVVAFLASGFAPAVVPEVFRTLLREVKKPEALAELPYRKRLMYANLLIHILQGETIYPDEDWYPMGNSIANGCDRGVYCHPYHYYYDPSHRYEPRFADDEYEKPARKIVRHGSNQEKPR